LFCGILLVTGILQIGIVQFTSEAFHVAPDGLDKKMWLISILIGAGSLPVQQIINFVYAGGIKYRGSRSSKRRKRDASLSLRNADASKNKKIKSH
jgi:Ca2+ transporting ATPase